MFYLFFVILLIIVLILLLLLNCLTEKKISQLQNVIESRKWFDSLIKKKFKKEDFESFKKRYESYDCNSETPIIDVLFCQSILVAGDYCLVENKNFKKIDMEKYLSKVKKDLTNLNMNSIIREVGRKKITLDDFKCNAFHEFKKKSKMAVEKIIKGIEPCDCNREGCTTSLDSVIFMCVCLCVLKKREYLRIINEIMNKGLVKYRCAISVIIPNLKDCEKYVK